MHELIKQYKQEILDELERVRKMLEEDDDLLALDIQYVRRTPEGKIHFGGECVGDAQYGAEMAVDNMSDCLAALKKRTKNVP